jgi:ABC-type transport system substrate-binding protein
MSAFSSNPASDPTQGAAAAIPEVVFNTIYEGLLRGRDGRHAPPLARNRMDRVSGGRHYEFTLRHGVRFHDGEPF